MVYYKYRCYQCYEGTELSRPFGEAPDAKDVLGFCACVQPDVGRVFGANVYTFKPYSDPLSFRDPVEFSSRRQRDDVLEDHGFTYDTGHWSRKPIYKPAIDSITLDDVKKELYEHGPRTDEIVYTDNPSGEASIDD